MRRHAEGVGLVMLKLWGGLMCKLTKHKRGKRVHTQSSISPGKVIVDYRCVRCGAEWSREQKVKV